MGFRYQIYQTWSHSNGGTTTLTRIKRNKYFNKLLLKFVFRLRTILSSVTYHESYKFRFILSLKSPSNSTLFERPLLFWTNTVWYSFFQIPPTPLFIDKKRPTSSRKHHYIVTLVCLSYSLIELQSTTWLKVLLTRFTFQKTSDSV